MTRIHLEAGVRPWEAASDVTPVSVYHEWNVPLIGLVRQAGNHYLFACLLGEESDTSSVWAYAPMSTDEIQSLESTTGGAFDDAVDAALRNKCLIVAFANKDRLDAWLMVDAGEESPLEIVRRFINLWKLSLEQQDRHADEIARSRELVDA